MAYTAPTSNTVTSSFNETWASLYDAEKIPQIYPQWFKKYNKGFGIKDWLYVAGQTFNVKSNSITAFEDGAEVRPIRVNSAGIAAMTSAGDDITFYLHADEYDANNDTYLRVGDTIVVPSKYLSGRDTPAEFLVTVVGATSAATCTAQPLDATTQITTQVAANDYLMVGATRYARGVGQPAGRSLGAYSRTFNTGISKESYSIEGGQVMQDTYRTTIKGGGGGLLNRAQIIHEFALDNQMNEALLLSDTNSNSLVQTSDKGKSNAVRSTTGLWNHLDALGQELNFAVKFALPDLYTAKELLRSQGVVDTEVLFAVGDKLSRGTETMGLEYLKEFSGGSNLLEGMSKIGIRPRAVTVGNVTFNIKEFAGFSNPTTFGTDADYWGNAGMIIPMSQVTVKSSDIMIEGIEGGKISIPNVALGYVNNNGENRTRIVKPVAGVNGLGFPATHDGDLVDFYMLTEYMLVAMQVNQMIRVLKEGTY